MLPHHIQRVGLCVCGIVYYLRTTPLGLIRPFVEEFDEELRAAFEEVVGCSLSEAQWDQAVLGPELSGMRLCTAADIADAAYLASRANSYEKSFCFEKLV